MHLVRVISSQVKKGLRLVKFLGLGKDDVQETHVVAPFGVDAHPVKGWIALYARTASKGEEVLVGYVNKSNLADVGEHRIYSTNENGEVQTFIWLKNDGTIEVGGDSDFMVRYSKLETAFNELKQDFNSLVNVYNAHMHPYTDDGSPATTSPTTSQGQTSNADISPAKIEEIKTI